MNPLFDDSTNGFAERTARIGNDFAHHTIELHK
jgi:hypothetical protein